MPFVRNLEQALDVIEPERAARLCLDILYGRQPNSLVNQRILYLLADRVRPALQQSGTPFGRPHSRRDRIIDQALGLLSVPADEAVPELVRLFEEARGSVRGFIALALGATKSQRAAPILLKAFQEEERAIAWCVADALLDLDDRSVIPPLITLYDDPTAKWGLQQRILYVLGRMRATEARGLIERGLEHPYIYTRSRAVDMLWLLAPVENAEEILWKKLGFSNKGPEYDSEPVWDREYLQHRLVTALGRVGTGRSIGHLLRFRRETLPDRPPPETDVEKRERQRLEQSLDRAIRELQRRDLGGMHA
jgi:HEAT repeat protein